MLDPRQRKAIEIYVGAGEMNGRKTCILYEQETGERYPQPTFQKHIKLPEARKYMDELLYRQGVRVTSIRNRVVEELSALAFSNLTDVVGMLADGTINVRAFEGLPKSVQSAIKSVKLVKRKSGDDFEDVLEITMHDKKGALDSLKDVLSLKRRIGEELDEGSEREVLRFAGVSIIAPKKALPEIELELPEEEIELDMPIIKVAP